MDRLVRARILLAEAAALGVTIEDLIAESSAGALGTPSTGPTVAEDVNTVAARLLEGHGEHLQVVLATDGRSAGRSTDRFHRCR